MKTLLITLILVLSIGLVNADDVDIPDEIPDVPEISIDEDVDLPDDILAEDDEGEEPLDEVFEPEVGRRLQYTTRYRLDSRYMGDSEHGSGAEIMAAEAEVFGSWGDKVDFALQIPLATGMKGRGRDMHFGNAYAVLRGKVGEPTLKVGQFVVPFGNLVDYETHTTIMQTLYPNSLGIRIDQGVEIEGYLGDAEYQVAVTTGNGPYRRDIDSNKVVAGRIFRKMEIGDDDLRIGVSALKGRLPVFSLMDDPLMGGRDARLVDVRAGHAVGQGDRAGFADKTRFGVDIEYYRGIDLIRAEFVAGSDEGRSVDGQWMQIEHPLNYRTSIIGQVKRWRQSTGSFTGWGVGVEHKAQDNRIWRAAYENRRVTESLHDPEMSHNMPMKMNMGMFTLQYLVEF